MGPYILAGIGALVIGLSLYAPEITIAVAERNQRIRLWVYRRFDVYIEARENS